MSRAKKGDPGRRENDQYETPQWCVDELVRRLLSKYGGELGWGSGQGLTIVDVGAGDGRIGLSVRKAFPLARLVLSDLAFPRSVRDRLAGEVDLVEGDFLQLYLDEFPSPVLLVGNPPFSLADEMVVHSVRRMRSVLDAAVFLLRLNWLGSEARAAWMNANTPSRLTVLAPRPSFCVRTRVVDGEERKSANDSCEYAWIWWQKWKDARKEIEVAVWPADKAERRQMNTIARAANAKARDAKEQEGYHAQ